MHRLNVTSLCLVSGFVLFSAIATAIAQSQSRPFFVEWSAPSKVEALHSIDFLNAQLGWAAGENGTILATADGGDHWQPQTSGIKDDLWSVHFIDTNVGMAVGEKGAILTTIDGGNHWRADVSGTKQRLTSIFLATTRVAWVVGEDGTLLITRDGGVHWRPIVSSTKENLSQIYMSNEATGWIVGQRGTILVTRDGGGHWIPQPSSTTASLWGLHFVNTREGWAAGANGLILSTTNGGDRWQHEPSGTHKILRAIHFVDPRNGWIAGANGAIQATRDGGYWLPQISGTDKNLWDVHFVNTHAGWVVGDSRTILATRDGGDHWQPQTSSAAQNLLNVQFADSRDGWAVGVGGTILATHDSGDHWQPQISNTRNNLWGIHMLSADTGWVVGDAGTILTTRDGGAHWQTQAANTAQHFSAVFFSDSRIGCIVGWEGLILITRDGGSHWTQKRSGVDVELTTVRFADERNGWATGLAGTILVTRDGGDHWAPQNSGTENDLTWGHFADAQNGWMVGLGGTILVTHNGGNHWALQNSGSERDLTFIFFADQQTGWAVGLSGTVLATRDGGEHWIPQPTGTDRNLWGVNFGSPQTGWIVGDNGTLLRAGPPKYAPAIDRRETEVKENFKGGIDLSFVVHREGTQPPLHARMEYRAGGQWIPLEPMLDVAAGTARCNFTWNPAASGLATNQRLEYRVRLDDRGPALQPFYLGEFVYKPWWTAAWRDHQAGILATVGGLAIMTTYLAVLLTMLWVAPARLAGLKTIVGLDDIEKPTSSLGVVIVLGQRAIKSIALPWFVRHKRVRRSWISVYNHGGAKIASLSTMARESFLQEDDFLDAWVERRVDAVRAAIDHLDLFRQRRVYVALPVRVHDGATGQMIEQPTAERLRFLFGHERVVIPIVGGAGTGKSTLACAIARWAVSSLPEERLTQHRMLPVFVVEDTANLTDSVARSLRRMIGDDELPADLVQSLLRKRRLLVVVDALSERSGTTQDHVRTMYEEGAPINALVITSRREPDFGALERTSLYPERLTAERLIPFIFEYLRRRGEDDLFTPREQIVLGERVLMLAETGGLTTAVTPLLATLFVESAVERIRAGKSLDDIPDQIPEVFLDYIRRLDPSTGDGDIGHDELIRGARILAQASLGETFTPKDFRYHDGLAALQINHERATSLIQRLVSISVVERRDVGGIALLRFGLDSVAEYLAAIAWLDGLANKRDAWVSFVARVQATQGYPKHFDSFLVALSTCYRTYRVPFALPALDLPWEKDIHLAA